MIRILIVDDEPMICKGISALLSQSGLNIQQVYTASGGQEALDYLRLEEIDLLITDIQMGEMSGIELMHQAKILKPWVQAIVISAHETFQYAQLAMRLGAKDYLIKPLNNEQLLDTVRNVVLKMNKTAPDYRDFMEKLKANFSMQEPQTQSTELLIELLTIKHADSRTMEIMHALQERYQLPFQGPYYSVLKITADWQQTSNKDAALLRYAVHNVVCESLDRDWVHHSFYSNDEELTIILQWSEADVSDSTTSVIDRLEMLGRLLHNNVEKYVKLDCRVGLSQVLKGAEFLPDLNRQASKAIAWNRKHRDHAVFYYGDLSWSFEEEPSEEEILDRNNRIVEKAKQFIHEHFNQKGLTLHEIARQTHVSPNYLSYLFKKNTDYNLWEYVIKLRMEESKHLILTTDLRRYEIAERVGYESPEHFSKIFKKYFGCSPSELKK